jgi:hypothetical protein
MSPDELRRMTEATLAVIALYEAARKFVGHDGGYASSRYAMAEMEKAVEAMPSNAVEALFAVVALIDERTHRGRGKEPVVIHLDQPLIRAERAKLARAVAAMALAAAPLGPDAAGELARQCATALAGEEELSTIAVVSTIVGQRLKHRELYCWPPLDFEQAASLADAVADAWRSA